MSCAQNRTTSICVVDSFGTVWHNPQSGEKSSTVLQNKRWHPSCPCSCHFTAALNMKLCSSELVLSRLRMEQSDEIRPSVSEASRSEGCLPMQWNAKQLCAVCLGKPCHVLDHWFPQISILRERILDWKNKTTKSSTAAVLCFTLACCFLSEAAYQAALVSLWIFAMMEIAVLQSWTSLILLPSIELSRKVILLMLNNT